MMNNAFPLPEIFGKTDFLIFYNDKVYELSNSKKSDFVKIYGKDYGLKEVNWDKVMNEYYKDNKKLFKKLIKEELEEIIAESKEDAIDQLLYSSNDKSYSDFLFVDQKIYDLTQLNEFISKFKEYFDYEFYNELENKISYISPKELSQFLMENKDLFYGKDLQKISDKIYTNERTVQMNIDGKYVIHLFNEDAGGFMEDYKNWIKLKLKVKALNKMKWRCNK